GPWLTFRLNERTRRLELYKLVYPVTFRVIQKLMTDASELRHSVWHWQNHEGLNDDGIAASARDAIVQKADAMVHSALAQRWLLGSLVCREVQTLGTASKEGVRWTDPEGSPGARIGFLDAYDDLSKAVRRHMLVSDLTAMFGHGD